MGKLHKKLVMSFRAKVLVPVILVMVLLVAVTIGVVNQLITKQSETEARRALRVADLVIRHRQAGRTTELIERFRILAIVPVYRSAFQTHDPATIRVQLTEVLHETSVDIAMFTPSEKEGEHQDPVLLKRDATASLDGFERASTSVVQAALQGEEGADTIQVGEHVYELVSVPVVMPSGELIGVLTLGTEIGKLVVNELRDVTQCDIALLANGRVIATSQQLATLDIGADLNRLFQEFDNAKSRLPNHPPDVRERSLGNYHYYCAAGRFVSLKPADSLGYLLLSSSEPMRLALADTKSVILSVGLVAILLSLVVVWVVVRKITGPLEELRDSAEAVGQGDFSRRVVVRSQDECGQLAQVFNQMTENLKQSREQLQLTVDTLRTTQAQLIQSEKLSGIGEFVAGVAHELNNPLTSVLGFSELLAADNLDPRHKRYLDRVQKSAERCQKIVQALLSFARRHKPERKAVCVNSLIEAALEILSYQLRTSNIQVTTQLDPRLPLAMVDPHQIQQVFLNLINNARQAIEAHLPKGWIKITSSANGQVVRVTVQDSGPGITPENLSKIFDPFFTTKEIGKGTGLGLSLCYGIIREHGGTILPRSQPGEGATFIIELPITHETTPQPEEPSVAPEHGIIDRREGAGKRVLVIDDEEPILQLVREALTARGYQVDLATDGETGLRCLSQTRYDVALCDWKMPGLSGRDVFERLRATDRAQAERMIFITGDVVSDTTRAFFDDPQRVFLPKPFTLVEVREAIGKVLNKA